MPITVNPTERALVEGVIERLARMPGVTKVVPGAYSETRHHVHPGEAKIVERQPFSAQVRIYGQRGMQNVHVYTKQMDEFVSALSARLVRPAPVKDAAPEPRVQRSPMASALTSALETGHGHSSPQPAAKPQAAGPKPNGKARSKPTVAGRIVRPTARAQPHYPAEPAPLKPAMPVHGAEVQGRLVTVDPDTACNWLERNTRNRRLRDNDVKRYAADMKAGRWIPGGNVIKFDRNGTIVNGQHTLWAVIEAGVPVEMYVMSGLDPDAVMVEDDHARRTIGDAARITSPGRPITTGHGGIARLLRFSMEWAAGRSYGAASLVETRQEQLAFLERHWDAVAFAYNAFSNKAGRRGLAIAPVMAPLARAYYTEDRDMLRRFAQILQTGLVENPTRENVIVLLRNQLMQGVGALSTTMVTRQAMYHKVERALRAFLDGEHLKVLKVQERPEELFPLPDEPKRRKPRKE